MLNDCLSREFRGRRKSHVTYIPLMDVMKVRHEREKALVDSLRQQLKAIN